MQVQSGGGSDGVDAALSFNPRKMIPFAALMLLGRLLIGCGPTDGGESSHSGASHGHVHVAPHGGAAIPLGDHLFHLEFVLDSETGTLDAFVLDGHLEYFVRIESEGFDLILESPNVADRIRLLPVASEDTGETVGDTSQFRGQSDTLIGVEKFSAVVERVEIRDQIFEEIQLNYPEGNE